MNYLLILIILTQVVFIYLIFYQIITLFFKRKPIENVIVQKLQPIQYAKQVKLLVDVVFEMPGIGERAFKKGMVFAARPAFKWINNVESNELDGYFINNGKRTVPEPGNENPGTLYETKCFLSECEVVE